MKSLTETVIAPPSNGQEAPVKVTYNVGVVVGGAAITGLRASEIGDFWKYVVAHIEDAEAPPEWKQRLRATLPVWNNLQANAEIHDLTLQMPMIDATLKTLGETIGLTGFVGDGAAEIGVKIDELAFKSPLLPPWAEQLSPASLSLDLRLTGKGLDEVAGLALDDPNFGVIGDLSPETQDKIGRVLLAGRPKVTLSPGRLTTPLLDLAFEGEASADTGAPSGRFIFSADGLDKTIALLQDIGQDRAGLQSGGARPDVPQGPGHDRSRRATGLEGRRDEAGDVSVNGTPLPTGK